MGIPVNIITWVIALSPIFILLLLMIKFQLGSIVAAPIALIDSIIFAFIAFKADVWFLIMQCTKGVWNSLSVIIVIVPAVLIYEISKEAGTEQCILSEIKKLCPNKLLQILAIGAVFPSFLQGITGFGVPVAVGAPLLIGIGIAPIWAVIIPLLGQAWGGTFGTLAVAWDALISQTQIGSNHEMVLKTAFYAGIFIWLWNFICYLSICWFYGKGRGLKKGLPAVIVLCAIQGGGQLLLGQQNQTMACFLPSCVSMIALLFLGKTRWYNTPWEIADSQVLLSSGKTNNKAIVKAKMSIHQAFLPYYFLTLLTVVILLIRPLKEILSSFEIGFSFPEMVTGYDFIDKATDKYAPLAPLTHAGMFLLLSAFLGFFYYKRKGFIRKENQTDILKRTFKRTLPSGLVIMEFIVMSRVMSGTGMTMVLAYGISSVLERFYIVLTPFIGMLGSFMTSSTMSSNILFGEFQLITAKLLKIDPGPILAAQTAGGSIGNMISPGSIVLGATTAGIIGSEGKILKKIIPLALFCVMSMGIILILLFI